MASIQDFDKLLDEKVFEKSILKHLDFHRLVSGNIVKVPYGSEIIQVTGFIGEKAENKRERNHIQYERSSQIKGYIPMEQVGLPSVEKKTKEKKEDARQKKLKDIRDQLLRRFKI
ncbi:MAG: hypothetical protein AAB507_01420 [Patescibacteria group bacterium]